VRGRGRGGMFRGGDSGWKMRMRTMHQRDADQWKWSFFMITA